LAAEYNSASTDHQGRQEGELEGPRPDHRGFGPGPYAGARFEHTGHAETGAGFLLGDAQCRPGLLVPDVAQLPAKAGIDVPVGARGKAVPYSRDLDQWLAGIRLDVRP
jgi:hypothetical protein